MSTLLRQLLSSPTTSRCCRSSSRCLSTSRSALLAWKAQQPHSSIFDDDTPSDLSEDEEALYRARPGTPPIHARRPPKGPIPDDVQAYKSALQKQFPDGWNPPRKLSRDAMDTLRELHRLDPEKFSTPVLAGKFKISPEAIRRILKSKYEPSEERRQQLVMRERRQRAAAKQSKQAKEQEDLDHVSELQDRLYAELNQRLEEPLGVHNKDRLSFK